MFKIEFYYIFEIIKTKYSLLIKLISFLLLIVFLLKTIKIIGISFFGDLNLSTVGIFQSYILNELNKQGKYNIFFISTKNPECRLDPGIAILISDDWVVVRRFIKANNIKIIFHDYFLDKYDSKLKKTGIKIISILHTEYFGLLYCCLDLLKMLPELKMYDAVIYPVEQDYYIFHKLGIKNLQLMPNYLTYDPNNTTCSNLQSKNILLLGEDKQVKALELGINAMYYIIKKIPDAKMFLITDKKDRLLNIAKKLGIYNSINFVENCRNPASYIKNSSVMLYTSYIESFSQAISEGLSYCLPVITNNLYFLQLSKNNVINAKPDDPENMAEEAIKILNDYNYRNNISNHLKYSIKEFSHYNTTKKWNKLIEIVLKNKKDIDKYFSQINSKKNLKQYEKESRKLFKLTMKRLPKCKNITFEDVTNVEKIKKFNTTCF